MIKQIIIPIVTAVLGYLVGWFHATDKIRFEVFKRKLDAYQKLNKLTTDIIVLSVKEKNNKAKYERSLIEARISLFEFISSNTIILSNEVSILADPFRDRKHDVESLRKAFNSLSLRMCSELRLGQINKINEKLFNLISYEYLQMEKD